MSRHTGLLKMTLFGAAAGAAGTTALNTVTYLDMAVRGRPTSSTPEDTVEALSHTTHVPVPGHGQTRDNRLAGLGPLTGIAAGVGVGALLGAARSWGWLPTPRLGATVATVAALLAGNAPMTLLGVTDPRSWPPSSWAADVVPHFAYGAVTAATLEPGPSAPAVTSERRRSRRQARCSWDRGVQRAVLRLTVPTTPCTAAGCDGPFLQPGVT